MSKLKFHYEKDIVIKQIYVTVSALIGLFFVAAITVTFFTLKKDYNSARLYFEQNVIQTASNLNAHIQNDFFIMKNLAESFAATSSVSKNEVSNFLKKNIKNDRFFKLGFAYPNGNAIITLKNNPLLAYPDWSKEPCFANAVSGNRCFSEMSVEPEAASGFVNSYFVPVFNAKKEIIGVLGAEIDSDFFQKIFEQNSYDGQANTHIVDSDGNFIVKSQNGTNSNMNFFYPKMWFIGTSKNKVMNLLKTKDFGSFRYRGKDWKIHVVSFAFIGNNNLYVLSDIPQSVITLHVSTILSGLFLLVITTIILLLALFQYTNYLHKVNNSTLYRLAFTDKITNNDNKAKFLLDLDYLLKKNQNKCAIISCQISNFETLNEIYTKKQINKIQKDCLKILKAFIPQNSLCATDISGKYLIFYQFENQENIIDDFLTKVQHQISLYNETVMPAMSKDTISKILVSLKVNCGIYVIRNKSFDPEEMIDFAYTATDNKKFFNFYDESKELHNNLAIEKEMKNALKNNQFKMFLQPKINIQTLEVDSAEALIRWVHPTRGIVPPITFLPLFERNAFILETDMYILNLACEFLAKQIDQRKKVFPISINLSPLHLKNEMFVQQVLNIVKSYNLSPKYIQFEFKEIACKDDNFNKFVKALKSYGFSVSIDNFGTGISSLNTLQNLKVVSIKIDRSIINSIKDENGKNILKSLISMINSYGFTSVAEGIETREQFEMVKKMGCIMGQGFFFARPLDEHNFSQNFIKD